MKSLRQYFKGENFMTPYFEGYFGSDRDGILIELSSGTGLSGDELWGVTVARPNGIDHDASDCFSSRDEAEDYISELLRVNNK